MGGCDGLFDFGVEPSIDPADALQQLLTRREAAYAEAHVVVDTDGKSAAQVAEAVRVAVARRSAQRPEDS